MQNAEKLGARRPHHSAARPSVNTERCEFYACQLEFISIVRGAHGIYDASTSSDSVRTCPGPDTTSS
jgi:hypothetical protein